MFRFLALCVVGLVVIARTGECARLTQEQRASSTKLRSLLSARARVSNSLRLGSDCQKNCDKCGKKSHCTGSSGNCCWQDKEKDCSGPGDKSCDSKHCEGSGCITQSPTFAPTSSPTTAFEMAVLSVLNEEIDTINSALEAAIPSTISIDETAKGKDKYNYGICTAEYKYKATVEDVKNLNTAEITEFSSVDSSLISSGSVTIYGAASVSDVKVTGSASASCGTCGISISVSGDASAKIDATGDMSLLCDASSCTTSAGEAGYTISDCAASLEDNSVDVKIYDEKLTIDGIPSEITDAIASLFTSAALTDSVEAELVDDLAPTIESAIDSEIDSILKDLGCVAV